METAVSHRTTLRSLLADSPPVMVPQVFNALTARLCARIGFAAGYIGGASLGHSLAVSEALLTASDLASVTSAIRMRSGLPLIVDIGVGFGDAVHVTRAVWELELAGASALELEDQVSPKRASHHRDIEHLVPLDVMTGKIRFAVEARTDPELLLIARTGAMQNEDFERAIERCGAYLDAGADVVMVRPCDERQLAEAPARISGPVALLTSFDLHPPERWRELGYSLIIDGLTGETVSFQAIRQAYERQWQGLQSGLPPETGMSIFEQLHELSGTEELYRIERETTEPGT